MNKINIREINKENWEDAARLSVKEHQKSFVPSVTESLAFAFIKPWDEALDPYLIYAGDEMIGFFYISYTPGSKDNYWIGGFLIDEAFQGLKYGKESLRKIIDLICEKHPKCEVISLTVEKENSNAIKLYEKASFISEGKSNEYGEVIYRYACRGKNGI